MGGEEACPPDVYGRYVESFEQVRETLDKDPANVVVLERALALFRFFDREAALLARTRAALDRPGLSEEHRAALHGLAGHLLVRAAAGDGGIVIIFQGRRLGPEALGVAARAKLLTAVDHLRKAIRRRPKDARAREDLATALERLDREKNGKEVARLRAEALLLAGAAGGTTPRPAPVATDEEARRLRDEAEKLEQTETGPDHAAALLLRKQALVLDHCTHTIPFAYDASMYGPISLLAREELVATNLTRTYVKRDGSPATVPPRYYPAPEAQRVEIIEGLARDASPIAVAALLAVALTAEPGRLADAAVEALVRGNHEALRASLPRLLEVAIGSPDARHYPVHGQVRLVRIAARVAAPGTAEVLAKLLDTDRNLFSPRGIAAALAEAGSAEQAGALLAVARDPTRDLYFRREAIFALGRLAPARLGEIAPEPYLELAAAAARCRAALSENEAARGRVLAGIGRGHETDDAARYCADLDLREAIPLLEDFARKNRKHYARPAVEKALHQLRPYGAR